MTMTIEPSPAHAEGSSPEDDVAAQVGAFAERLLMTGLAGFEAMTIALGRDLGLYAVLGSREASNAAELAEAAAIAPRYAREWLEQQAAASWIDGGPYGLGPGSKNGVMRVCV